MNSFFASHDLQGNKLPNTPQTLTDKRFRCVWQTDAALSFIDRHKRDPFFLYLAYFTPHVPLESPEPWFSRTPESLPKERRQALAMIAAMDEGIGKLRAKLAAEGIEKNTLIFFISDNGAPLKAGAWDGSLNLPLVGEKGMLTDGGIRTPFLAAWPGTFPAGKTYDPPVINLDVAATAVAIAGLPSDDKLDGKNLIPFVQGANPANPHDALFWRWRSQAAIRAGHWKLILLGKNEKYLFDMDGPDGQTEIHNLIAQFPDVAADLENRLMAWNATLPPPGLPRDVVGEDRKFFDEHVIAPAATGVRPPVHPAATVTAASDGNATQDWLGRNCTLVVAEGALHIHPGKSAGSPFITRHNLKLAGPVTATLRLRCPTGGEGRVSWRTADQPDFPAAQTAAFKVLPQAEWQEVKVQLSVTGRLVHVRIAFSGKELPEVRAIELTGSDGKASSDWSAGTKGPRP